MASPTVEKYGIMHVIRNSFLTQNYHYSNYWDVAAVETVRNSDLEEQFQEKRKDFIHLGRTTDELTERLLMGCYIKDKDIKFISLNGLQCGKHGTTSYLGNGTKGVTLGKHADILLKSFYNDGYEQCWIVVYKVICGRQKEVLHIQTPPYREPNQDADCHVSILAPVPAEDCLPIQDTKAQVFMFDKDENGDFLRRPRQCVPIACVKFKRASPIGADDDAATEAANQMTTSELSSSTAADGGNTKDSITLLKDSLAKMKENFVLLSKETVIGWKTNHTNPSMSRAVRTDTTGHGNCQQQPTTELNKGTISRSGETRRKDALDKRKSTTSDKAKRASEVDRCSATEVVGSSEVVPTDGAASAKKCIKKLPQKEIHEDRKLKPASVNASTSDERSIALSALRKVTSAVSEQTLKSDSSLTRKRGQLLEPVSRGVIKDPLTRTSSTEMVSQVRGRDGTKSLSEIDVLTATVGKEINSRTDRRYQVDASSRLMPIVSNRKTRLIDALPVSPLSSDPSLTSAFSRRPSTVVTTFEELPKTKSILRNPILTVQNGSSSVATLTSSSTSALQSCSDISSRLTTTSSVREKQLNCFTEAPSKATTRPFDPRLTNSVCKSSDNSTHKPKDKVTLNFNTQNNHTSPSDDDLPVFHLPTSSPSYARTISIGSTGCSMSALEYTTKTTLATSLNSSNIALVDPRLKFSSSLYRRLTSNSASQDKPVVSIQTSGTAEIQLTQTPVTCSRSTSLVHQINLDLLSQDRTSQRAQTNSNTLIPAKTHNNQVVPNQIKSAFDKRNLSASTAEADAVSLVLPTTHSYSTKSSNQSRIINQSKSIHSTTKQQPKSEFPPLLASTSVNGNFTSTCSNHDANNAICLKQNDKHSPTSKESGAKPILKSAPDNCKTKDVGRNNCKTKVIDIPLDAPIVAIPKRNLLMLQHGFISSITKQLASDLNDVANLLRSSKFEKSNHGEKQAYLSLREINSKFTELTPICVQYKKLFRHLKDGQSVLLPELDQLYSQEYMMNECCNVLGRVFSEFKASQLKSETVLQKRSLAITWLVDRKTELISCINNIRSIVENVVSTCELRPVPLTKYSPPTPETSYTGNKRKLQTGDDTEPKELATTTQKAVKEIRWSPVHFQDLGQIKEVLTTERSSLTGQAQESKVTTEANSQSEINESAASVSIVDHSINSDRSPAAPEEVMPPLHMDNCLDDRVMEVDKDRETTHLPSETSPSCENGQNLTIEKYSEQSGNQGKEFPMISAVEESSPAEEERDTIRNSTVSGNSSQSTDESNTIESCALVSPEDGIASVEEEHPSILTAAADAENASSNSHHPIKTEHIDPPTPIAHLRQTIILGADDFIAPYILSQDKMTTSSIGQSTASSQGCKSVNNNDGLPLTDFCCDIVSSSVIRLRNKDCSGYESCVSLESKPSVLSLDSLDEIPPLLTPDCAFGYSSIVYNIKSDEPPILEANATDETLRNFRNPISSLDVNLRHSPPLIITPRDSPRLAETSKTTRPLVITPRNSPPPVVTPRSSPPLVVTSEDLPPLAPTPRDSPPLVITPRNSPPLAVTTRDTPPLVITPRDSPVPFKTPIDLSTFDAPHKYSSTDTFDLVPLMSGSDASTIIMNIDEMATSNSSPSDARTRANDEASQIEQNVPTDIQMKVRLQAAKENDKSEENCYARIVGELTCMDVMAVDRDMDTQNSVNCQNQSCGKPMTDCLQSFQDHNSNENTCPIIDASCDHRADSDQAVRPDDDLLTPEQKKVYLKPSPLSISDECLTTDLSMLNMKYKELEISDYGIQTESEQRLAHPVSLYIPTSHHDEPFVEIHGSIGILCSHQSHYVYKIEPDDDYDPDPVCLDDFPKAAEQPSASTCQVLLDAGTRQDDEVSHQVYDLDSSKPGDDAAVSFLCGNIEKEPQVSSDSSTEALETVICKSSCSALPQEPMPESSSHEPGNEHEIVSESQSGQNHTNETSLTVLPDCMPATHTSHTDMFFFGLSSSESVSKEFPEESEEVNLSLQVQRMSVSSQMPQSSSPVTREEPFGRCHSPPTVYTEPPQSPPPEPIPLIVVIKKEIPNDLDSLVEMRESLLQPKTTCRKRKRENKQNQEEPICVISAEDAISGCSEPLQKQPRAPWLSSIQSSRSPEGPDLELKDSIARVVQFCLSDATVHAWSASRNPFRAKTKTESTDQHHISAVVGFDATHAAAIIDGLDEDKLVDVIKPKMMSVCFMPMQSEGHKIENGGGKTNGERSEERYRSSRNNISYIRESASRERCQRSRIRDIHTAEQNERRPMFCDSSDWRTTWRIRDDQRERPSNRLSSGSQESSLRERRYRQDEGRRALPVDGRFLEERSMSRRPNIRMTPREHCWGSEGRSDNRSGSYRCSPVRYEDQRVRSRITRPILEAPPRPLDIRNDVANTDHSDDGFRTVIDPLTLKRQFWSKGHPRFRCHDGCDHRCMTAPPVPQDADKRHRNVGGSGEEPSRRVAGNSLPRSDRDILEETLKLNLEMMEESSKSHDDGERESSTGGRRGSKRSLPQSTNSSSGVTTRRSDRDSGDKDYEAESRADEEMDDFRSTTSSSKRSKTMSRREDKDSDGEDRISNEPTTDYDYVDVDRSKRVTSASTDGRALQPSRSGGLSVISRSSGSSEGRISVGGLGDEETQGISTIRMTKSTLQQHHHFCSKVTSPAASPAAATRPHPSGAAAAASVNLSRTSVTYVTQILQTSNFSTQVCVSRNTRKQLTE